MKIGFIFAGQGQQFLNMGHDLVDSYEKVRDLYIHANEILGYDVLNLSQEQLNSTEYTQPALFVLGVALDVILKQKGIKPDVVCGLSLGEYNALYSSGVIDFETGLSIIKKRAKIMNEAFEPFSTGMVACLRTDWSAVQTVIDESELEICNYNSPRQVVIGGRIADIDAILPKLKQAGILAIKLKVSTVSHMSLLEDASVNLKAELSNYSFSNPNIPFINNISAVVQERGFVETLSQHIAAPTRLSDSIALMDKMGVDHYIEVGPKGSISKLVKEVVENANTDNVYDVKTLEEVVGG